MFAIQERNKAKKKTFKAKIEEETAQERLAREWGVALILSAQNTGSLADLSSVPISAVVAPQNTAAVENSIIDCIQHDSEAAVGDKHWTGTQKC